MDTGTESSDGLTSDNQMIVSGVEAAARWEYRVAGGDWQAGSGSKKGYICYYVHC
jgi:hypothetical protein